MTQDRALKRAIRQRMEKTGEKYTEARRAVSSRTRTPLRLADAVAGAGFPLFALDPTYHNGPMHPELGTTGLADRIRDVKLHCLNGPGAPGSGVLVSNVDGAEIHPQSSTSEIAEDHLVNFIARFIPDAWTERRIARTPVLDPVEYDKVGGAVAEIAGERCEFVLYAHREWPLEFASSVGLLGDKTSLWVAAWKTDVQSKLQHLLPVDAELVAAINGQT